MSLQKMLFIFTLFSQFMLQKIDFENVVLLLLINLKLTKN